MAFDIDMIKKLYSNFGARIDAARKATGKSLTLTEKILYAHLWQGAATTAYERGKDYVEFARIVWLCRMQLHKWLYYNSCRQGVKQ